MLFTLSLSPLKDSTTVDRLTGPSRTVTTPAEELTGLLVLLPPLEALLVLLLLLMLVRPVIWKQAPDGTWILTRFSSLMDARAVNDVSDVNVIESSRPPVHSPSKLKF